MPQTRPFPSMTIPRGFHFHYEEGAPRTPEPQELPQPNEPPQAPRQPLRRTTRRLGLPTFSPPPTDSGVENMMLPTIEQTAEDADPMEGMRLQTPLDIKFLAPQPLGDRLIACPKTPLSQQLGEAQNSPGDYFDRKSVGESISRPSTACSTFSDSSMSSQESMESFPSFGGGSASPESESQDPFVAKDSLSQESLVTSPIEGHQGPPRKRLRAGQKTSWSQEMDSHLWSTFLAYLRDPSHTPFKLFPGSNPPLGVCSRVANDAKKTWRSSRGQTERQLRKRVGSPDTTIIVATGSRESTPTGIDGTRKALPPWPRNSSTRRRLRILCKRNPSLSAHYQRLMQNRSPSPFESSSSSGRARPHTSTASQRPDPPSFSTRDMNISLITTTSSAMQFGNPLSELTSGAGGSRASPLPAFDSSTSRFGPHQRSHSLQLGIEASGQSTQYRTLASPFQVRRQNATWHSRHRAPAMQNADAMQVSPKLEPPLELHDPAPLSRSLKKRARMHFDESNDESRESLLKEVFGAPADSSHRRVRTRGFSLGDMNEGARHLSSIFTPPALHQDSSQDPFVSQPQLAHSEATAGSSLAPPLSQLPPRLGSPFAPLTDNKQFNTIPRNFKLHIDTHNAGDASPSNFDDRLGALAPGRITKISGSRSLGRSFARNNPAISRLLSEQENL